MISSYYGSAESRGRAKPSKIPETHFVHVIENKMHGTSAQFQCWKHASYLGVILLIKKTSGCLVPCLRLALVCLQFYQQMTRFSPIDVERFLSSVNEEHLFYLVESELVLFQTVKMFQLSPLLIIDCSRTCVQRNKQTNTYSFVSYAVFVLEHNETCFLHFI